MYAYFFTNPLKGATLWKFQAMIKGIPKSTLNLDTSFNRTMAKVTSQECFGNNDKHTRGTATASTDASGITCTNSNRRTCMDKQTQLSTSKDSLGSTCADYHRSACTDISTDSTDTHRITCSYISTKGKVMNGVTSTEDYTVKTVAQERTNTHDMYRRYEPKRY